MRLSGLFCTAVALAASVSSQAQPPQRTITVHAKKYAFEPAEITVKKGEPVKIILLTDDTPHGLAVPELGIHLDAENGKPAETVFTPAGTGDFPGKCSRFCGVGHRDMKFQVHVSQ